MEGGLEPLIGEGLIDPTEYQSLLYAPSVAPLRTFIATLNELHASPAIAVDARADRAAFNAVLGLLGQLHQPAPPAAIPATLRKFNRALAAVRSPDDRLRADLGLPPGTLR
ncbi:MAG TPA: hypothetical protein VL119_11240 [Acidimicrobiia bacterium]|nr:hypothetical protein [Acidimicrobiia bacterium]